MFGCFSFPFPTSFFGHASLYKLIKSDRGEGSSNDPLNGRASKKGPTIVQVSEDEEEVLAQEPTTGKAQRKRKAKAM